MIESISAEKLDRLIALRDVYCLEDPYILRKSPSDLFTIFYSENQVHDPQFRLLIRNNRDAGYCILQMEGRTGWIREIFVAETWREVAAYGELLEDGVAWFADQGLAQVRHTCPQEPLDCTAAFCDFGFDLAREHIQMEMPLQEIFAKPAALQLKPFYTFDDPAWLMQWVSHCSQREGIYSQTEIEHLMAMREPFAFVAFHEDQPVGMMIAEVNEQRNQQEHEKVFYIEHMAVAPDFRLSGIATGMLDLVFRKGIKMGLVTARLHVFHDNDAAYRLYEKLGFVEVKRINHWVYSLESDPGN